MSSVLKKYIGVGKLRESLDDLGKLSGLALTLIDTDGKECHRTKGGRRNRKGKERTAKIAVGNGRTVTLVATTIGDGRGEAFDRCVRIVTDLIRQTVEIEGLCGEVCTRFEELNLFYDLAGHIVGLADTRAASRVILKRLLEILKAGRGSIMLATADRRSLEMVAAIGGPTPEALEGRMFKMDGGLAAAVVKSGEPLIVSAAGDLPRCEHPERAYRSVSFASLPLVTLPMKAGGEVIGVINVTDRVDKQPFSSSEVKLLTAVAAQTSLLVQTAKLLQKNKELLMNFARSLSYAIDAKDSYTHGHSLRVTERALGVAAAMSFSEKDLQSLELAGLLHDIGKIGIPETILNKQGALTDKEYAVVKEHPVSGSRIIREITEMANIAQSVRHHHERYDGRGYPDGLAGEAIPLPARILAIADAFDAITSTRPYRGARTAAHAMEELRRAAGSQFDPQLVETFVRLYGKGGRTRRESSLQAKYPGLRGGVRVPEQKTG